MKARNSTRFVIILVAIAGLMLASVGAVFAVGNLVGGNNHRLSMLIHRGHGVRAPRHWPEQFTPERIQQFKDILNRDALLEDTASALGIPAADLETARKEGTLRDLLTSHEVDNQALQNALQSTMDQLLADAVAAGTITQDEADVFATWQLDRWRFARQYSRHRHMDSDLRQRLPDVLDRDALLDTAAATLDIAVSDLRDAQANGTLQDLLAEHEVEYHTLKEAVQSIIDQILADAVAAGTITQDEADSIGTGRTGGFKHHGDGFRFRHSRR